MQVTDYQGSSIASNHSTAFEEWLEEVWPKLRLTPRRLLVHTQAEPVRLYAGHLAHLLGAQLAYDRSPTPGAFDLDHLLDHMLDHLIEEASGGYDLTIFEEPRQPVLKRLFGGPPGAQAVRRLPTSVLVAREPRWPLRRILFVTKGQEPDAIALDWLVDLAEPSGASVNVLAVLPAVPSFYSEALTRYGLSNWLKSDTPLGHQLRQINQRLPTWTLTGKLRFRPNAPDAQIKQEVAESDPDLVIMAGDVRRWWQQRVPGRLVDPLLRWIDRPVLVVKSKREGP